MTRTLVARTDGLGDVLLTGPAVRAIAASGAQVTMLVGPAGSPVARRLPGARDVIVQRLPWIDASPESVERVWFDALVEQLTRGWFDNAVIFTSFHQSALPLALACRLAGIGHVAAISEDYAGSLLDVRHHVRDDIHEVERNLSLVGAIGLRLPAGDDGRLAVERAEPEHEVPVLPDRYVVVHPGASAPARTLSPMQWQQVAAAIADEGFDVVVTGGATDTVLTRRVAGRSRDRVHDIGGACDFDALVSVLAGADALVAGNTGPSHLAAAVGTPVVSIFSPTVPSVRWRPWAVRHVLLGDQRIACRDCRARVCPFADQPCLAAIRPSDVVESLHALLEREEVLR